MAQPQPLADPLVMRFPGIPPAGLADSAAAIGLWQEKGDGVSFPTDRLKAHRVFVAGRMRTPTGSFISVARYNPEGGPADAVASWPPPTGEIDYQPGAHFAVKGMVIPAVEFGTTAEQGRVFVTGTIDSIDNTTDIIVLAYDFDLNLKWMKTFNYVETGIDYATPDEVVAITTDQSSDLVTPGHDTCYNFVAVLGRVRDYHLHAWKSVTLVYCRRTGNEVMPPRYEPIMPEPVDITIAQPLDFCGVPTVFITGSTSSTPGYGDIVIQAYQLPETIPFLCPSSGKCSGSVSNGVVPAGWPLSFRGQFGVLDTWAAPARIKFMKSHVVVAGTTGVAGQPGYPNRTDFFTLVVNGCDNPYLEWHDQWSVPNSISNPAGRACKAVDMDLVFGAAPNSVPFIVVTGSARNTELGNTSVATMVYRSAAGGAPTQPAHKRHWLQGGTWNVQGGLGQEEPIALRCIKGRDDNTALDSGFNIFVAAKTKDFDGYGFATIKYDGGQSTPPKTVSWTQNLPFYFGTGSGDDTPAGIAVEYLPSIPTYGPTRRIWVTGTSRDPVSLDDWATQFIIEQMP